MIHCGMLNYVLCYLDLAMRLGMLNFRAEVRFSKTVTKIEAARGIVRKQTKGGVVLMETQKATAMVRWTPFTGGFHWQAVAYAIWESFFCIGICLGLLVLFREKYNRQGPLSRFLAANAFGVYVFHTPLLVAATLLVRSIAVYPFLKMILMSVIILPACFGFSHLLRKLSLLRNIFS
jgi:hypothetical protein